MDDLYRILGVKQDAARQAIKKAYREKALSEHPDKGGTAQRMALLTTAYEVLSDPIKREEFDREWEIFNASDDPEIPVTLSGYLPTAGVQFSKHFRQLHAQFVKQCLQKPLDQNLSPSIEAFRSDLYSSNRDDLFSFIKVKRISETKLNIGILTPEKAIEYFIKFLQGEYCRNNTRDLAKAIYKKIKQLEIVGQAGDESKLFCGIYEILLVAAKGRTPSSKILFSLQKITDYARRNTDQTMIFMAPLLQSKYFRNLFSQALHYYWLSEENALDETYTKAFNGEEVTKSLIERLKSILSENRNASKSYGQVAKLLRYARLLYKLEQDINKSAGGISTTNRAVFYRQKAFHLLDWLPSLKGFADHAIIVNIWLQIGITMQRAAAEEPNPILCMADEKLATQMYAGAAVIGQHATPDVELYACLHSLKCFSCRYTDSEFKKVLKALQHRALWLADLFPFFQTPQSNAGLYEQEDKTLVLMSRLLHALIDKIDGQKDSVEKGVIDHSHERVFYQAYEACVKNWYEKNHDLETEKKFRQHLMKELLVNKQWTIDDINYNLNAPWPLSNLDEEGWTCPESSILPLVKEVNIPTYKTVRGVEFNYKTGEIDFILDYCKPSESDHNRLLTFLDLSELFQRCLKEAIFSLDPVDPDMPYHPFNQMRFGPSTLYHSQLLHTMFLTDYLLKFLTVGQEVQRREPYELRCLDRITAKLPDHLKKVIYNFHASNQEVSLSRFWIESEGTELAIDDEELTESGNVLFALGNIRMVVKHHKMERDAEGNIVDKEGENEGWDCYILTEEQKQKLCDGKRSISDSALIIIKESWELNFWENNKITHRFTLEEDEYDLKSLSKQERDSQEKIKTDNSEALRQIYRIVLKAADKTGMPHRFSPEFVFAQEFTKFYDDFAIYFPEFGRLRELSKTVCLVNIMAVQRKTNQEEVNTITARLSHKRFCGLQCEVPAQVKEHNYWQKTREELKERVTKAIIKQFEEWRAQFSKEKLKQKRQEMLNDIRRQIGTLTFTRSSPEVEDICNKLYDNIKSNIIAQNGLSSWELLDKSRVYTEGIDPQIPSIIRDLTNNKKTACREQLLKLFQAELDKLARINASQLVENFLEGYDGPLLDQLVYYDSIEVAEKVKAIYPEHTLNILDNALNNNLSAINAVVNCEYEKVLKRHEQQLKVQLSGREKLEKTFIDLGFGSDTEDINLDGTCLWVPASFRRDAEKGHSRTVYGGVAISGMASRCIDPKLVRALARQTSEAGKRLMENRIRGNALNKFSANILGDMLSSNPKVSVKQEHPERTPLGRRNLDIVITKKGEDGIFKPLVGFEIKSGNAPFTEKQRKKDSWIQNEKTDGYPIFEFSFPSINKDTCKIQ